MHVRPSLRALFRVRGGLVAAPSHRRECDGSTVLGRYDNPGWPAVTGVSRRATASVGRSSQRSRRDLESNACPITRRV